WQLTASPSGRPSHPLKPGYISRSAAAHRHALADALSLLMLFAERAQSESVPPINPKLVYIYLISCIGCGLLLSTHIKQKEACLVYAGQMLYFAVNFYTNPQWNYPQWQRIMMSLRQFGCLGVYVMLAYVIDNKRSIQLRRIGEICLGLFLMSYVYLLNSVIQYKEAFYMHMLGGDGMRYLVALTLAGCALSFFSGFFLRDMSICAAATLLLTTLSVDLDLSYWMSKNVHQWNQIRQLMNNGCAIVGLFMLFTTVDNRIKVD
ncbi:hypothetical protein BaRGS_00028334, partial [Batillaria attramentaria]